MIGMEEIKERRGKNWRRGKKEAKRKEEESRATATSVERNMFRLSTNGRSRGCAGEELLVRLRKRPALIGGWAVDPAALTR